MNAAQNRFKQVNAPEGLEPAAPNLLERMGQATEAKRLASRGLQGLAPYMQ